MRRGEAKTNLNSTLGRQRHSVGRAAVSVVLFACLLCATQAHAQEPIYDIDISAQPLAEALEALATQTGSITLFPYNLAEGVESNVVRGRYTVGDALERLIEGTGLSGVLAEERVIGIELDEVPIPDPTESVAVQTLEDDLQAIPPPPAGTAIEEITVSGIRGSLQQSAYVKQRHRAVMDAITAEELGKFPDINVADSLARVTGVGITRTRGGEGQFVTVRGLGEEFNAVTYNGRVITTENNGREFSFDVFASELIARAEVFKTPTPSQGDGSLGGRVNILTERPLDSSGFRSSVSLAGQYEGLAKEWGPRATIVLGNNNAAETLGFTASFSYQKRDARTDVAESTFLIPDAQVDADGLISVSLDTDRDGFNDTTGAAITHTNVRFNGFAPSVSFQERERIGGTFALEWRPDERTDVLIDALYTNFKSPGTLFGYSYFPSASAGNFVGTNAVVNERNQAVAFEIEPFALDLVSRFTEGRAETLALGANVVRTVNENLTVLADASVSFSEGNRDNFGSANGSGTFFVLGYPSGPRWSFDATGGLTPDATFAVENIEGDPSLTSIENLTADDIRLHVARRDTIDVEDDIVSLKLGAVYDYSPKRSLSAGIDYLSREKTNMALDNSGQDRQGFFRGYRTRVADVAPGLVSNLLTPFNDNFLRDAPGNFPRVFPTFRIADLETIFARAGAADVLNPSFHPTASSVVREQVLGSYVSLELDGDLGRMPYQASMGVRFAYTDLESMGALATIDSIVGSVVLRDDDGVSLSASQAFDLAPSEVQTIQNDYFDVLPSLLLSLDLTDRWKLRLAASRTLSRPTLTDLSTRYTITSNNLGGEQITSANPLLEAIRSNNLDLSLEWYADNGAHLAIAAFYKDVSNFVSGRVTREDITIPRVIQELDGSRTDAGLSDISFFVSTPTNGDTATISGIEIGGQYFFDSGFGLAGNVTLTDSDATVSGQKADLENISELAWNASAFFERGAVQARASLNHRSDYLIGQTVEGGLDEYGDDFTQLDLSVSYSFEAGGMDYRVFAEGINVTNEKVVRLSEFADASFLEAYEDNGARYVLGIRANF